MVIGEHFAWAHLPKTAGDAAAAMFAAVPGLVQFADPPDSNDKHAPFFAREVEVSGKLLVMNIRRLPAWILSGAQHAAAHGEFPDYRPLPLPSADEMTNRTDADDLLRWMTDHGRFTVDRWLRAETLEDDLLTLLEELNVLTPEIKGRVMAVGRVNEGVYDHALAARFSPEQLRRCYARNPNWSRLERRLYGSLSAGVAGEGPDLER
jgi:hypothetical protein